MDKGDKKDKNAKDAFKAELQEWKLKAERLGFEKNALLARLRELPAQHKKEITTLKTKLSEVTASKNEQTEESQLLGALSSAVLSLYLEIKERKVLRQTDEAEIEQRQLMKTHPVVVLSYLRTHLRALLASHEDSELDLRVQLKLANQEADRNVKSLEERMEGALEREKDAISKANGATAKLEDAELAKDAALDDTRGLIEQVKSDQMTLIQQMRAKGEENEKLQQVIAEKDKQLKKQETKMLKMAGLESEIQSLKAQNLLERKKLEAQHVAKTASFQKDLKRQEKVLLDNQRLLARVQQLEVDLKKAKTSYTVMHYHDEQAKTQRLESLYRTKSKACEEAETKIKGLEKQVDKYKEEAKAWEGQYQKLFEHVKKQHRDDKKQNPVDYKLKAEELSLSYYQDLVGQKNKEIQKLTARIKLLSTSGIRSKLTEKRFEEEKMDLTHRLGQVQMRLAKTEQARKELLMTTVSSADLTRMMIGGVVEADARPASADPLATPMPARPSASRRSVVTMREEGESELDMSGLSSMRGGLDMRHLTGRPQSAMSRESLVSGKLDSMAEGSDDEEEEDEEEDGVEFGEGKDPMVKWARDLEDDNNQLRAQLKQFHNILAVSQGAADAYKAVVSSLQVADVAMADGSGPGGPAALTSSSHTPDDLSNAFASIAPQPGGSKVADRRRSAVNRNRMGLDTASAYHPARPQSAPPGREKVVSRPSSAQPAEPAASGPDVAASSLASVKSIGRAGKRIGLPGGGVPRPASAQPPQRPSSALGSSVRWGVSS